MAKQKSDDGGVATLEPPKPTMVRQQWRVEVKSPLARVPLQTITADSEEAARRQWESSTGLGWGPACSISRLER